MAALTIVDTAVFIDHFRGLAAATAFLEGLLVAQRAVALLAAYTLTHGLGIPDALIAAVALAEDATLVTSNIRHFRFIPGLRLLPAPYRLPQDDS